MFAIFPLLTTLCLFSPVCLALGFKLESPFGLTFTPTTIIASRFNGSGLIGLTKVPATTDYKTYYNNLVHDYGAAWKDNVYDTHSVMSMFRNAVSPLTQTLHKHLDHMPNYSTLFLPSVFQYEIVYVAADAVLPKYSSEQPTISGLARKVACYGYGFLEGRNLGREPSKCNDDGPENLILVLEYEEEYLHAWVMVVAFDLGTYPVMHQRICKDCGERFREDIGAQAYTERVSKFLDVFINDKALQDYDRIDSIRAIIVAGEASSLGVTELGDIAQKAVGTDAVKVMTEIDASKVVAHGAAVFARKTQKFPREFDVYSGNKIVGHDEL